MVVEARVGAYGDLVVGAGGARPVNGLGDKAGRTSSGMRGPAPKAAMEHVAALRGDGQQRVITAHVRVGEAGSSFLVEPIGLADG